MDFEFYRNFITVAETGNITAASRKLSLAQPALSAQIRTLEEHYGIQLIKKGRGRRHVVLTEAGMEFLRKAQQLCQTEDNLILDMQNMSRQTAGTLRISVSYVASQRLLADYLLPFAEKYPGVNFQVREEAVSEQIQSLKNGVSELAFANAPLSSQELFSFQEIRKERFAAIFQANRFESLRERKDLNLEGISRFPIACNYGCYGLLRKMFSKMGVSPEIRFISTTGTSAMRFATSGNVVAVVSGDCTKDMPETLMWLPISEDELYFSQTIYWPKKAALSPITQLFLRFCHFNTDL